MHQIQILKTLILKHDQQCENAIPVLTKKGDYLFPNSANKALFSLIIKYYNNYNALPDVDFLESLFDMEKDNEAKKAFMEVLSDDVDCSKNLMASIDLQFKYVLKSKSLDVIKECENNLKLCNVNEIPASVLELNNKMSEVIGKISEDHKKEIVMYGEDEYKHLVKHYDNMIANQWADIKTGISQIDEGLMGIKPDDFFTAVAYTSQGKSTLLRYISYVQAINGKNVVFTTHEMSSESIRLWFLVLHANNVDIWGWESPKITYKSLVKGLLSPDDKSFVFNTVAKDLYNNPNYGTIHIVQPKGTKYTNAEYMSEIRNINKFKMPVDAMVNDYITLMKPTVQSRDNRKDINEMIAEVRQFNLELNIPFITCLDGDTEIEIEY